MGRENSPPCPALVAQDPLMWRALGEEVQQHVGDAVQASLQHVQSMDTGLLLFLSFGFFALLAVVVNVLQMCRLACNPTAQEGAVAAVLPGAAKAALPPKSERLIRDSDFTDLESAAPGGHAKKAKKPSKCKLPGSSAVLLGFL